MTTITTTMVLAMMTMMGWLGGPRPLFTSIRFSTTSSSCSSTHCPSAQVANTLLALPNMQYIYCPCPTSNLVKLPIKHVALLSKKLPKCPSYFPILTAAHNTYNPPRTAHRAQMGGKLFWMRFGFGKLIWIRGTGHHLEGPAKRHQESAGRKDPLCEPKKVLIWVSVISRSLAHFRPEIFCSQSVIPDPLILIPDWRVAVYAKRGLVFLSTGYDSSWFACFSQGEKQVAAENCSQSSQIQIQMQIQVEYNPFIFLKTGEEEQVGAALLCSQSHLSVWPVVRHQRGVGELHPRQIIILIQKNHSHQKKSFL